MLHVFQIFMLNGFPVWWEHRGLRSKSKSEQTCHPKSLRAWSKPAPPSYNFFGVLCVTLKTDAHFLSIIVPNMFHVLLNIKLFLLMDHWAHNSRKIYPCHIMASHAPWLTAIYSGETLFAPVWETGPRTTVLTKDWPLSKCLVMHGLDSTTAGLWGGEALETIRALAIDSLQIKTLGQTKMAVSAVRDRVSCSRQRWLQASKGKTAELPAHATEVQRRHSVHWL